MGWNRGMQQQLFQESRNHLRARNRNPAWISDGIRRIKALNSWRGTAEDLRFKLLSNGFEQPHHHNAWGALIRAAVVVGAIHPLGRYVAMKGEKARGRRTQTYALGPKPERKRGSVKNE